MHYLEFSFIGFDDSPVFDPSISKQLKENLHNTLKYSILYRNIIPLSGFDSQNLIKQLQYSLNIRKQEFHNRTQVVIILFDSDLDDLCIQTKALNNAFFSTDIRN